MAKLRNRHKHKGFRFSVAKQRTVFGPESAWSQEEGRMH